MFIYGYMGQVLRKDFSLEELGLSHQTDSENANHAQGIDL